MSTKVIERNSDRLSNLPDPIIHHILSLMNTKYSVRTCVLSKKWSHHWTHIHSLNFDFNSFSKSVAFGKFVLHVLHNRKPFNLHRLNYHCGYSLKVVNYHCGYSLEVEKLPPYITKTFQYAISHGVEELETDLHDLPPCCYGCQTLVTLNLHNLHYNIDRICSFGFGSLSTLKLSQLILSSKNNNHDLFPNYSNLKNLIVKRCSMSSYKKNFTIVSSSVVYLEISSSLAHSNQRTIVISAPRLELFNLKVTSFEEIRIYKCPLLRKMNLRIIITGLEKSILLAWEESIDWKQEYFWELTSLVEPLEGMTILNQSDYYHSIFLRGNLSHIRFLPIQQLQFRIWGWTRLRWLVIGFLMERWLGKPLLVKPSQNLPSQNLPSQNLLAVRDVEELETYLDDLLVSNSVDSSN